MIEIRTQATVQRRVRGPGSWMLCTLYIYVRALSLMSVGLDDSDIAKCRFLYTRHLGSHVCKRLRQLLSTSMSRCATR